LGVPVLAWRNNLLVRGCLWLEGALRHPTGIISRRKCWGEVGIRVLWRSVRLDRVDVALGAAVRVIHLPAGNG